MSAKEKKHSRYELENRREKNKIKKIARHAKRVLKAKEKAARRAKRPKKTWTEIMVEQAARKETPAGMKEIRAIFNPGQK